MNNTETGRGTVLVTGAASGIGKATAVTLVREGWHVVALDRDADALKMLGADLEHPTAIALHAVDIARTKEVVEILQGLQGPICGLVCCAAKGDNTPFLDVSLDSLRSLFEINFMATFALCQVVSRRMAQTGGGSIVNISSVSGLRANAGRTAYGSSKAALEMMSKIMAVELAPQHIRVNTLAPGPTQTAMAAGLHVDGERQRLLRSVPQGRYASPQEIAEGVSYLIDGRRSGFVTGHTLCVDGGMYAAGSFDHAAAIT